MKYLIDDLGIHYFVEDAEADQVAAMQTERAAVDDAAEIPLPDAVRACHDISAWIERLDNDA